MRRDSTDKTCSLAGISDLTVIAPIKRGLVPSLDAVTYKSRVKHVLRLLHLSRTLAHENELARVLSDAVERVGRIHSVRIAVLEPEDQVLLAVTFDGAWQSYVRVIWQKVARLLDLIFCNTEGYVLGGDNSYEEWGRWLRAAQAKTSFLYAMPGLTVDDASYLRMEERLLRRTAGVDLSLTQLSVTSAEEIADSLYKNGIDPGNAGYGEEIAGDDAGRPAFRQALRTLVGLHRLIDVFPAASEDGRVLRSAARELLPEFLRMVRDSGTTYQAGILRARERFSEAMRWFEQDVINDPLAPVRIPPPLPATAPYPRLADIQGGILQSYSEAGNDATHGCLLLLAFESAAALDKFLDPAMLAITSAADAGTTRLIANIAFTPEGLRLAGLSDDEIEALPDEFVQGMERRAGILGDLRMNHPLRWNLPAPNWSLGAMAPNVARDDPRPRISLGAVHAVLQVRLPEASVTAQPSQAPRDLLMVELQRLATAVPGVIPLSIQWMERLKDERGKVIEHFGYVDGNSQPVFDSARAGKLYENHVHLGEVLRGHANAADHPPKQLPPPGSVQDLLVNGSFLVVRKLRQDVDALDEVLKRAVDEASKSGNPAIQALGRDGFRAKMMGRWPSRAVVEPGEESGDPLARFIAGAPNDFRFRSDPKGVLCPFHAHIRRANPRTTAPFKEQMADGGRPARLFRRGMPYGARPDPAKPAILEERGLVFMAYNADIGEQFEVVQRWLTGGNSSGAYSGESDPFLGVAEPGRPRYFRFEHGDEAIRMKLDGTNRLHDEPCPLVRLEWGMYLFAPSLPALQLLRARAAGTKSRVSWNAVIGEQHIGRLREVESREGPAAAALAWKSALEDGEAASDFVTASIFAAIREYHHGVLRTPFGVLAASRELVDEVLLDKDDRLTATGYLPRMERSFGGIFLGHDARSGGVYERESQAADRAIMALSADDTFEIARKATNAAMQGLLDDALRHAQEDEEPRWYLTIEVRELLDQMLATFCEEWFGLSEQGDLFRRQGYRRDWQPGQPPDYPGHFMAPSRYFFQPHPGAEVERVGAAHGVALRDAMQAYLVRYGAGIRAKVTRAVLDSVPAQNDPGFAARTVAGTIMGFVPTVDGNLRRIVAEWQREDTLGALRSRYAGAPAADLSDAAKRLREPLTRAMQLWAVPDLLWRTAHIAHSLGSDPSGRDNVQVRPGDIVVAALASATQQGLAEGRADLSQAFGGGERKEPPAPTHPTHACPGRKVAMAMMLGFLSALVESPLKWRNGAAPLTLSLDGLSDPAIDPRLRLRTYAFRPTVWVSAKEVGLKPLLVIGDSWLTGSMSWGSLLSSLGKRGYGVANGTGYMRESGRKLKQMASEELLDKIVRDLLDAPVPPKAVVVGGGGNDVSDLLTPATDTPLYHLLAQKPASMAYPLAGKPVDDFVDVYLAGLYKSILDKLVPACTVPVLIHAYDHPIPDGVGYAGFNWLKRVFEAREFPDIETKSYAMLLLINRLNRMVKTVADQYPGRVHHVQLAGELAKDPRYVQNGYRALWKNELHANEDGFDVLAAVVAAKLASLGV